MSEKDSSSWLARQFGPESRFTVTTVSRAKNDKQGTEKLAPKLIPPDRPLPPKEVQAELNQRVEAGMSKPKKPLRLGRVMIAAACSYSAIQVAGAIIGHGSVRGQEIEFPVDESDRFDKNPAPTVTDALSLSPEQKFYLDANFIPRLRDYLHEPFIGADFLAPNVKMTPEMTAGLTSLTYTENAGNGIFYGGQIGHASVIERNGELFGLTIAHVADAEPASRRFAIEIPNVGTIPLDRFHEKVYADVEPDAPDFVVPKSSRADPPLLIPLNHDAQLFLRLKQAEGIFTPMKASTSTFPVGTPIEIPSHYTGKMFNGTIMMQVPDERANGGRKGQYIISPDIPSIVTLDEYTRMYFQAGIKELASQQNVLYPISRDVANNSQDDNVICQGFSGTPVFARNARGESEIIGLVSNGIHFLKDEHGAECGISVGVEPI